VTNNWKEKIRLVQCCAAN